MVDRDPSNSAFSHNNVSLIEFYFDEVDEERGCFRFFCFHFIQSFFLTMLILFHFAALIFYGHSFLKFLRFKTNCGQKSPSSV